mmetsp:Transcript_70369/g.228759  ORF Transcript_70369/g.228759 Transcript_70369/m.228759 type:complete len:935 (+) Transcript_70369:112-2916(+)
MTILASDRDVVAELLAASSATNRAELRAVVERARPSSGRGPLTVEALLAAEDVEGNTLLHLCARQGDDATDGGSSSGDMALSVGLLLAARAAVDAENAAGETPLLSALRAQATADVARLLLGARADPGHADGLLGETPLMEAACSGHTEICRELLRAHADLAQRNLQGQTALELACASGHRHLAPLLQEQVQPQSGQLARSEGQPTQELPASEGAWRQRSGARPELQQHDQVVESCSEAGHKAPEQHGQKPAAFAPASRRTTGLQRRCQELGIPFHVLGAMSAANVVQEWDRLSGLSLEDLRAESFCLGLKFERCYDPQELVARLGQVRIWKVTPMLALQAECRKLASHVVEATPPKDGVTWSREELVEALSVATWGGTTRSQQIEELCASWGIPVGRLESLEVASRLLAEVEGLETRSDHDLKADYKRRGFALDPKFTREDLIGLLRDILIWEQLPLSELREVCKKRNLPMKGDFRRADLLQVLAAETWATFGIPLRQLPGLVVACGILDRVQRWQARGVEDLKTDCIRQGLAYEAAPEPRVLVRRLTDRAVWDHLPVNDLRQLCQARGAKWHGVQPADANDSMQASRAERQERREMIRALVDTVEDEVWASKGVDVRRFGDRDVAVSVFRGIERLEAMDEEELREEYELLGMPLEPEATQTDLLARLRSVLIWQDLPLEELLADCKAHDVSTSGLVPACGIVSVEDKRMVLLERLLAGLCAKDWEKRGIPVARLESFESAVEIIEEWAAMEDWDDNFARTEYGNFGLPHGDLRRPEIIQRLKSMLVWSALQLAELRKECYKHGVSAMGDRNELVLRLAWRMWAPESQHENYEEAPTASQKAGARATRSSATGQPRGPQAQKPATSQLAGFFAALGLPASAGPEDVRKAYRRLALQHHPDKNPERPEEAIKRFRIVKEAYEKLSAHLRGKPGE